jgi:hypothetical protein
MTEKKTIQSISLVILPISPFKKHALWISAETFSFSLLFIYLFIVTELSLSQGWHWRTEGNEETFLGVSIQVKVIRYSTFPSYFISHLWCKITCFWNVFLNYFTYFILIIVWTVSDYLWEDEIFYYLTFDKHHDKQLKQLDSECFHRI